MRLLIVALFLGVVSLVGAQVSEVREVKSGNTVRDGGIFNPSQSLKVTLDPAKLGVGASPAADMAVKAQLDRLAKFTDAAQSGLVALRDYQLTRGGGPATARVSDALTLVLNALTLAEQTEVSARIEATVARVEPAQALVASTAVVFQYAEEKTEEIRRSLFATVPAVRVRLVLLRDPDQSRVPDAKFGILPGEESRKALQNFMESLKLPADFAGVTPGGVAEAIANKVKADAVTRFEGLRDRANVLMADYSSQIDRVVAGATGDAKAKWEAIRASLKEIGVQWETLKTDVKGLLEFDLKQANAAVLFEAQLNRVASGVELLISRIKAVEAAVNGALTGLNAAAMQAAAELKAVLVNVLASANQLLKEALVSANDLLRSVALMLNILDDMRVIGETLQDSADGTATFKNTKGTLEGLPTLRSYDQLTIRVESKGDSNPESVYKQVGEDYDIFAWAPNRWDNITALGFYTKSGTEKLGGAPILGQAFKFTNRSMSFQRLRNMMPGVGYSVIALDQDGDGQQEVGIGAMLTLLDDRLVGGYGYNTAGKGTYWYFGYRFRL